MDSVDQYIFMYKYGPMGKARIVRDSIGVSLFIPKAETFGFVPGIDFSFIDRKIDFVDTSVQTVTCLQTTKGVAQAFFKK
jgi:hypothetical protein